VSFCCSFCSFLCIVLYIVVHPFVLLFFFQLYCMFFFDLRLLITFFGIVKLFLLPSSSVAMLIVTVKGWNILSVLVLFYFKLSWIYTIQIMIESRIAQWQNIIYIVEAGIKAWWFSIAYSHRKWTMHSFRPSDNYTMYLSLNTDIYKLHT
jgi:hypothetical protein